jgi:hypothetical protein
MDVTFAPACAKTMEEYPPAPSQFVKTTNHQYSENSTECPNLQHRIRAHESRQDGKMLCGHGKHADWRQSFG